MAEAIVRPIAKIGMRCMIGCRKNLPIVRDAATERDLFAKEQAAAEIRPLPLLPSSLPL